MDNLFVTRDTVTLLQVIESIKPPATYLADTFFAKKSPVSLTNFMEVDFRKGKRRLAPYIVKGGRGVTVEREGFESRMYSAPLVGVRRVIDLDELSHRQFGENIYSAMTAQERAAKLQVDDLRDLLAMIQNRKNQFAADILVKGKTLIEGFADDGKTIRADEIDFGFDGIITPPTLWNNANAKIYDDLLSAVDKIAEESGELPDIMLCGANVESYLLKNAQIKDFMLVNNRANLTIGGLTPKYLSPQTRYLGTLPALGLEMYSYAETFTDSDGLTKNFIPKDSVIIAKAGLGRQMHAAVSLIDRNLGARSFAAEYVPFYSNNEDAQQISLTVYSRFILAPNEIGSWVHIKTCG